jgi:hypothetical protein
MIGGGEAAVAPESLLASNSDAVTAPATVLLEDNPADVFSTGEPHAG